MTNRGACRNTTWQAYDVSGLTYRKLSCDALVYRYAIALVEYRYTSFYFLSGGFFFIFPKQGQPIGYVKESEAKKYI